jgi:hypothetical protein
MVNLAGINIDFMEKKSKKELRSLIQESIKEAVKKLELPAPTKKMLKLVDRTSKKLAATYAEVLRKEDKKKKKAEKFLNEAIHGIEGKKKKAKGKKVSQLEPVEI